LGPGARIAVALAALVLTAHTCGPPVSTSPLTPLAAADADARLVGLWRGTCGDPGTSVPCFLHVVPAEGPAVDLVLVGEERGANVVYARAFPSRLGDRRYLNLRPTRLVDHSSLDEVEGGFLFLRYQVRKDGTLELWWMDDDAWSEAVRSGLVQGTTTDDRGRAHEHVTGDSAALAAFVSGPRGTSLFRPFATLRRAPLPPR
jgi:hypothetical protein